MDEKYSGFVEEEKISDWYKQKELDILAGTDEFGVFSPNTGGGPHGAQWNPGNTLCIGFFRPEELWDAEIQLFVNGNPRYVFTPENKAVIWFSMSEEEWTDELTRPTAEDLLPLFGQDYLDYLEEIGPTLTAADLQQDVIRFEIEVNDRQFIHYFLAATGESFYIKLKPDFTFLKISC